MPSGVLTRSRPSPPGSGDRLGGGVATYQWVYVGIPGTTPAAQSQPENPRVKPVEPGLGTSLRAGPGKRSTVELLGTDC